jgi:hypothetical protein
MLFRYGFEREEFVNTGVVNQYVEAAKCLLRFGKEASISLCRHVGVSCNGLSASGYDFGDETFSPAVAKLTTTDAPAPTKMLGAPMPLAPDQEDWFDVTMHSMSSQLLLALKSLPYCCNLHTLINPRAIRKQPNVYLYPAWLSPVVCWRKLELGKNEAVLQ